MRNILESPVLSIGPFQNVQREVIYSPYVVRKNGKTLRIVQNCSIHGKNREIRGPYNF